MNGRYCIYNSQSESFFNVPTLVSKLIINKKVQFMELFLPFASYDV